MRPTPALTAQLSVDRLLATKQNHLQQFFLAIVLPASTDALQAN